MFQCFLLIFLASLLLTPMGIATSSGWNVKQLPLIVLDKHAGNKAVHGEQALSQVK